jgi:hypothetical protein
VTHSRQLSEDARDLIRGLLDRKVLSRKGSGPSGAEELKKSRFLAVFDFEKVLAKEYPAEFIPPASSSQTDVSNFDKEFTSETAADSMVVSHMSQTMQDKTKFEGFTFQGNDKKLE